MDQQQSRWRRIGRQILWAVGLIVAVSAVVFVVNHFFVHRPLWDWLKLLIVPAVLAGGGLWFNRQQRDRELETARQQRDREVEIAERRTQDEALQAYFDQMGQLLLDKDRPLRQSKEDDKVRTLARARTLTLLSRLNRARKRSTVQFLYESELVDTERRIVDLTGADLSGADLSDADLRDADLRGANLFSANLRGTDLSRANLFSANLRGANLRGANLFSANLSWEADLLDAVLSGAKSRGEADLRDADLRGANLFSANLRGTDLSRTNLSRADLSDATGITNEELVQQAKFLKNATMPNAQKYEEWLKDKKAREEGG